MIIVGKEEIDLLSKKVKSLSFEYLDNLYTIDNCEYLKADGENLYGVFGADQEFNQNVLPVVVDKSILSVIDLNKYSIEFFETTNDEHYSSFNNLAMPYVGIRLKDVGSNCLESI